MNVIEKGIAHPLFGYAFVAGVSLATYWVRGTQGGAAIAAGIAIALLSLRRSDEANAKSDKADAKANEANEIAKASLDLAREEAAARRPALHLSVLWLQNHVKPFVGLDEKELIYAPDLRALNLRPDPLYVSSVELEMKDGTWLPLKKGGANKRLAGGEAHPTTLIELGPARTEANLDREQITQVTGRWRVVDMHGNAHTDLNPDQSWDEQVNQQRPVAPAIAAYLQKIGAVRAAREGH